MGLLRSVCVSFRAYSSQSCVRVRFAPSPTGLLHLGGLRTALYNFFYAKSHKGVFILRIEDTDQTRLVPGATEQLVQDLIWAGIHPDEGPSFGGKYGPYLQSERIHIYREEAEKLVKNQAAYYCFCTERRLELLKKDALRNRRVPKYDNHCRSLSSEEIKEKLNSGAQNCIRFKLVASEPYTDMVYGSINHQVHEIEGDPIILKTDGWPTYHLANVVDDHLMNISHVIRGVEWMQSTNKHLMIYKAFGYSPPQFAHLPLLLNPDGSKLSKRQGDLTVKSFKAQGILPRALINFVLQAGSGFDSKVDGARSLDDLISQISKISTNSCKLPFSKLPDFNKWELERLMNNSHERKLLLERLEQLVTHRFSETFSTDTQLVVLDEQYLTKILQWCLPRITKLEDLVSDKFSYLWTMPKLALLVGIDTNLLHAVETDLVKSMFEQKSLGNSLKLVASERNIPYKDLMHMLRKALSGLEAGPGVVEMLMVFGKELSLERLHRARTLIQTSTKSSATNKTS